MFTGGKPTPSTCLIQMGSCSRCSGIPLLKPQKERSLGSQDPVCAYLIPTLDRDHTRLQATRGHVAQQALACTLPQLL